MYGESLSILKLAAAHLVREEDDVNRSCARESCMALLSTFWFVMSSCVLFTLHTNINAVILCKKKVVFWVSYSFMEVGKAEFIYCPLSGLFIKMAYSRLQ